MFGSPWVSIAGLLLDVLGVVVIASGLLLSAERAVELGVMRLSGETLEERLSLPAVQDRLAQSRRAFWGLALIGAGFLAQIVGNWP